MSSLRAPNTLLCLLYIFWTSGAIYKLLCTKVKNAESMNSAYVGPNFKAKVILIFQGKIYCDKISSPICISWTIAGTWTQHLKFYRILCDFLCCWVDLFSSCLTKTGSSWWSHFPVKTHCFHRVTYIWRKSWMLSFRL